SPMLPWAQRAYETCLSAGSTAVLAYGHFLPPQNWSPHPELHRAGFHTKEVHRSKCFGGSEIGVPYRLRSGDLLHERQACCLDYTTRDRNGAGERSRTVVSALARPHSAVEPHPQEMVSPAGLSPTT